MVIFIGKLEEILISKGATHSIGLLGGFTPNLYNNTDVFEILVETIKTTPYTFAQDLFFGIDASAASFFNDGKYIPSISPFGSGITDVTYFRRFSNPQVITMRYTVATAGAGATQDVLTYTGRARYSTI